MHRRKMARVMFILLGFILLLCGVSIPHVAQGAVVADAVTRSASRSPYQGQPQTVPLPTNLPRQDSLPLHSLQSQSLGTSLTTVEGAMEWNRTYGGSEDEWARSVIQTADGGFAFTGYTRSFGAGGMDVWLVKTDVHGEVEWTRTYGGSGDEVARAVIQTADGGFVLAICSDYSYAGGQPGARLVKTDVNGNEEWTRIFTSLIWYFYSGIQTVDGGFAFVGYKGLMKTDANGNKDWQLNYGARAYSVIQTTDGGFALAGYTNKDFWLAKIDNQGTMEWQQTYGGSEDDIAWSVIETADGGFALAGWTTSSGVGDSDAWLVKMIPPETTPPELSSPEDLVFEEGTTGHVITWVVGDRYPGNYTIYTDSRQVDAGSWTNGTIPWNVDGLKQGTYNVTLVVEDSAGNRVSNTIWVTITAPETPPLPELPVIRIIVLLSLVVLVILRVKKKYK